MPVLGLVTSITGAVAIKPSGVPYDELKVDDIVVVDLDGKVVEVDEFANDATSFYVSASAITGSALGALCRVTREPFFTRFYGPMDDVELSRMEEFEWHQKGRDGYGYGHPYLLFKVKAS